MGRLLAVGVISPRGTVMCVPEVSVDTPFGICTQVCCKVEGKVTPRLARDVVQFDMIDRWKLVREMDRILEQDSINKLD